MAPAHTMTDSNYWAGHLAAEDVDHVKEIAGVIEP